ncbi:Metal-dependent hydrolase, endonuclease/exonuclease/phosphatase family [Micromonospora viridifaciens]|uniref:Metal-dependent hydrolase, endonuclease/exonuclease/phosphatase family n=1 Tax=Micromonospora viridifaciens TaxID=1881 RepID=A0A1C4Y0X9_MICVI|nr:endonuclease/exonuclease/phosphatase family protein [Micromonospora viridifaciens]SCF14385.1 Metal-dependent hydrolase, endonuclease/exonuclease/phosphatase family [Micromonospora viridifaciens]
MDGTSPRRHLARLVAAIAVVAASLGLITPPAYAEAGPKVAVMTRNLYLGGDLTPSIAAPTLPTFLAANAALLGHVDLVNFPARAALVAKEIRERDPDLVGLQEVALWRTGPIGDPAPATRVRYDYLALLMAELATSGHPYDVAVVRAEADLEAPAGAPYNLDVRLTMRDVILVRHGGRIKVTGTSSGNYVNNLVFPLPAVGDTATSTRGWTAVDAVLGSRSFRFVNTHLEAFHPGVRLLQAQELLRGPLNVPGRLILVGDLNSGPELPVPDNRLAYLALVAGRMVDTWPILHPGDPGYTAGLGDDLTQPADDVEHRIDMVMVRGTVAPVASEVFGTQRRTPDGRWASDHLGHQAVLALQ